MLLCDAGDDCLSGLVGLVYLVVWHVLHHVPVLIYLYCVGLFGCGYVLDDAAWLMVVCLVVLCLC